MRRLLAVAALLLCGCSSVRMVDSQVWSMSTLPEGTATLAGAHYRFERLPSQADQPRFDRVQAIAEAALARVGLVRDDAGAQYSVLLGSTVQPYVVDPWGGPTGSGYGTVMIGAGSGGYGSMFGFGMSMPAPTSYRREVSVVMRDLRTGQVVYETRASNEAPWADTDNVLRPMFEAALQDFPHPPPGVRQIHIEIPR
jgi:hypothetical protein